MLLKVFRVSIHEVDGVNGKAARTNNIEVRVGFKKPFEPGLKDYKRYDYNSVCGIIAGPGVLAGVTSLSCDGKLLTVLRHNR